tara:strand:- start:153 stop:332 length:180 start_codon:yes stop_codon:yes gene_type:complete
MKARFIKRETRQRCVVRATTIDVFTAIKPQFKNLGMDEVGPVRFWLHVLLWWRKRRVKK